MIDPYANIMIKMKLEYWGLKWNKGMWLQINICEVNMIEIKYKDYDWKIDRSTSDLHDCCYWYLKWE